MITNRRRFPGPHEAACTTCRPIAAVLGGPGGDLRLGCGQPGTALAEPRHADALAHRRYGCVAAWPAGCEVGGPAGWVARGPVGCADDREPGGPVGCAVGGDDAPGCGTAAQ